MSTRRIEKINELLRREISEVIQKEMKDPNLGFTTITRVETSKDIQYATVFTSVMAEDNARKKTIEHLNNATGFIQHQLSARIRLRNMPKLVFKLDTSIDHSMRISNILKKINEEQPPNKDDNGEIQQ